MSRKNAHLYKTENGHYVFFPSAPLVKLGWVLKQESAQKNASRARTFGQFIGTPSVLLIFLFITRYLNLINGIIPSLGLAVFLFALLFLSMFLISQGTVGYKKAVHGNIAPE